MPRTLAYLLAMLWGAVPAALAFCVLRPQLRRRLAAGGAFSPWPREAARGLLWMYCGGMAVLTLTPRWVVWSLMDLLHGYGWNAGGSPFFQLGTVSLTPFRTFAFSRYILVGNLLMFLPFGFLLGLLRRETGWVRALLTALSIPGFVECWQLLVGRAFDIDDLLLNTLGVLWGYGLWRLVRRCCPALAARFCLQRLPGEREN